MASTKHRYHHKLGNVELSGFYEPRFERVVQEFERNFHERGEIGASACVTIEGETVVDLWGGTARLDTGMPWGEDTVSLVFSNTKGAVALCAHILASRGQLDLDAPVTQYWPEYGQAGKEHTLVYMLLSHQSGLPAFRKRLPAAAFYDWDFMVNTLAEEVPFWTPGDSHGYQMLTHGWLIGELVRRISGKSLGTFFQEEVAAPLGLAFWIGLPEEIESRTARMIPAPPPAAGDPISSFVAAIADPGSIASFGSTNTGGYWGANAEGDMEFDSRRAHAAEIGAAGGITNARGVAGMYAALACGGSLKGVKLVDADTLARMSAVCSASSRDRMLLVPTRFTAGFMKPVDNRRASPGNEGRILFAEEAFGHNGAGGSFGFADPGAKMSFGYTMNKMGSGILLNDRGQSLVDATYLSLGYTSERSGRWIKA